MAIVTTSQDIKNAEKLGMDPGIPTGEQGELVTHVCKVKECKRSITSYKEDKTTSYVCPTHRKMILSFLQHERHISEGKCPPKNQSKKTKSKKVKKK